MCSAVMAMVAITAVLDKLGGEGWQRRKSKLKERIRAIAHELLLKTAAARALKPATPARLESAEMASFRRSVPLSGNRRPATGDRGSAGTTWDQANQWTDWSAEMSDFGKTEVAMRAAFAAAMAGMQVAIIAPTTLLARQHFYKFRGTVPALSLSRLAACHDWFRKPKPKRTSEGARQW